MPWTNFHSHTYLCDGKNKVDDYIQEAIKQQMPSYGVSGHAPVCFDTDWCINDNSLENYLNEVIQTKKLYKDWIEVYLGLEVDFIPGIAGRNRHIIKQVELDYVIGSIHFVDCLPNGRLWNIDHTKALFLEGLTKIFKNDFLKAAEKFYEITHQMIAEDCPDIIGHLDKIKMYNGKNELFSESEPAYIKYVDSVLNRLKTTNTIVEVNTRGYYKYGQTDLYPSEWILEKIRKLDIPVMLNSDSHQPGEISAGFSYAAQKLKEIGIRKLWTRLDNKWQDFEFNNQGLIL